MINKELLNKGRNFLKDTVRLSMDMSQTDQASGVPVPPMQKSVSPAAQIITLVKPRDWDTIEPIELRSAFARRRSRRNFSDKSLTQEELSFLLWATQGVARKFGDNATFRTVPSAGARHSLETYLCVNNVSGLDKGVYRYLPLSHELVLVRPDDDIANKTATAVMGQNFVATAAVVFLWAAIPYRMEWRYGLAAHKVVALDAGHVCQNLYLACEAISSGTCAIAAYDQKAIDNLIGVDGEDEFVIYLAPVGRN